MDNRLRGRLWNFIEDHILDLHYLDLRRGFPPSFEETVWCDMLHQPRIDLPPEGYTRIKKMAALFMKTPWYAFYDCIQLYFQGLQKKTLYERDPNKIVLDIDDEFFGESLSKREIAKSKAREIDWAAEKARNFADRILEETEELNRILIEESSAWRFDGKAFVPFTSKEEARSFEEASAAPSPFQEAARHMGRALALLRENKRPDYPNAVKEAFAAVEAASQVYTGSTGKGLGDCLKQLDVHPALAEGWRNIYGFTSDAGGIRHANKPGSMQISFNEAKYFLVTCSAFVNYLIARYSESPTAKTPDRKIGVKGKKTVTPKK